MPSFMGESSSLKIELDVPVKMRDGTTLYADVYRPDTSEKVPVLLQRTPYNKAIAQARTGMMDAVRAASHGYAVVIQDVRGRFSSEGEFYTFRQELEDGYDSVEAFAAQPWSTGKVGTYGRSYVGATQWLAAVTAPPSLACIAPGITASDYHEGWTYQGGALAWGFAVSWGMDRLVTANLNAISRYYNVPEGTASRLIDESDRMDHNFLFTPTKDYPHIKGLAPYFYDWIAHPKADDYWAPWKIEDFHDRIQVPSLNSGGWHDIFLKGTLRNFSGMRGKGPNDAAKSSRLIVGPWHHGASLGPGISGDSYFGVRADEAAIDLPGIHLRWYDHWLKGIDTGMLDEPPARIFVMGENVWREEHEWPLARTQYTDCYLHSGGKANTLNGDGVLSFDRPGDQPPDVFLYDPRSPVPTKGGGLCCSSQWVPGGAFDQREVEVRPDVLVYTSRPTDRDLEVTGPISVTLFAATSGPDTDFTAKLVDVCECGCTRSLTDGIIRARYRESLAESKLLEPGQVYEYTIDLVATSNVFKKGHSIRLEVSSSNFPRFDRNPNTGREPSEETEMRPAVQTILHDAAHPSRITLPIIPGA